MAEMDTSTLPRSPPLFPRTSLVCSYWRCIRIGSSRLARGKADQSRQCCGGRSFRCTLDLPPHARSIWIGPVIFSMSLRGWGVDGLIGRQASLITGIDHLTPAWTTGTCAREQTVCVTAGILYCLALGITLSWVWGCLIFCLYPAQCQLGLAPIHKTLDWVFHLFCHRCFSFMLQEGKGKVRRLQCDNSTTTLDGTKSYTLRPLTV